MTGEIRLVNQLFGLTAGTTHSTGFKLYPSHVTATKPFLFGGQIAGGPMELHPSTRPVISSAAGRMPPISRSANTSTASPSWIGPFATTRICTRP